MRGKEYSSYYNPFLDQIRRAERKRMYDALETYNKVEEEAKANEKDLKDAMAEIATWK